MSQKELQLSPSVLTVNWWPSPHRPGWFIFNILSLWVPQGARARHIQIHIKGFETYKSEEDQMIGILFETRALLCHGRHPPILMPGKWIFVINELLH